MRLPKPKTGDLDKTKQVHTEIPTQKKILREISVQINGEDPYIRTLLIQPFGLNQNQDIENLEDSESDNNNLSILVSGIPCKWSLSTIIDFFSKFGNVASANYGSIINSKGQINSSNEYSNAYLPRFVKITFKNPNGLKKVLKAGVPVGSLKRPKQPIPEPVSAQTQPETPDQTASLVSKTYRLVEELDKNNERPKTNDSSEKVTENNPSEEMHGLQRLLFEYYRARPSPSTIQKHVDEYMADYDKEEERIRKEMEEKAMEDDGWTLVGNKRKGVKGIVDNFVSLENAKKLKENKKDDSLKSDFYRFQRREGKRNEIIKLQQQFEEDRKKIAQLKASRKFRPF